MEGSQGCTYSLPLVLKARPRIMLQPCQFRVHGRVCHHLWTDIHGPWSDGARFDDSVNAHRRLLHRRLRWHARNVRCRSCEEQRQRKRQRAASLHPVCFVSACVSHQQRQRQRQTLSSSVQSKDAPQDNKNTVRRTNIGLASLHPILCKSTGRMAYLNSLAAPGSERRRPFEVTTHRTQPRQHLLSLF